MHSDDLQGLLLFELITFFVLIAFVYDTGHYLRFWLPRAYITKRSILYFRLFFLYAILTLFWGIVRGVLLGNFHARSWLVVGAIVLSVMIFLTALDFIMRKIMKF